MAVTVTVIFVCFCFFLGGGSFNDLLNADVSTVFLLLDQVVLYCGCCMMFAGIVMNVLHVSGAGLLV